jgi:hypothetical protein
MRLLALGVQVDVEIEDPGLGELLAGLFADIGERAPRGGPAGDRPSAGVSVAGRGPWSTRSPAYSGTAPTLPAAVSHACAAVNLSAVEATPLLAFHAGVVTRAGCVLVLPGVSGLGKTTLTAALLRRGWLYVSDESLALDWSGAPLHAYPRPLGLSEWSMQALELGGIGVAGLGERFVTAAELGAAVALSPGPVSHVLLLERAHGATTGSSCAGPPAVVPVHRADVLQELVRRGFTHVQDPPRALQRLAELLQAATVGRLTLRDPHSSAAAVDEWTS